MTTKRRRTSAVIDEMAAALLQEDPKYSADYLKEKIEAALKKKHNFSEFTVRTYSNIKKRLIVNIQSDNPLDYEWSIGACKENNIPDCMIPRLMEYSKLIWELKQWDKQFENLSDKEYDSYMESHHIEYPKKFEDCSISLTIREARWMSRLSLLVEKLNEKYKNDEIDPEIAVIAANVKFWLLHDVAEEYSDWEKISEALGRKCFDTRELDDKLFKQEYPTLTNFSWAMSEMNWRRILDRDNRNNKGKHSDRIKEFIQNDIIPKQKE